MQAVAVIAAANAFALRMWVRFQFYAHRLMDRVRLLPRILAALRFAESSRGVFTLDEALDYFKSLKEIQDKFDASGFPGQEIGA